MLLVPPYKYGSFYNFLVLDDARRQRKRALMYELAKELRVPPIIPELGKKKRILSVHKRLQRAAILMKHPDEYEVVKAMLVEKFTLKVDNIKNCYHFTELLVNLFIFVI